MRHSAAEAAESDEDEDEDKDVRKEEEKEKEAKKKKKPVDSTPEDEEGDEDNIPLSKSVGKIGILSLMYSTYMALLVCVFVIVMSHVE